MKKKPTFSGFGKPGEKVEELPEQYLLSGKGTDLGCVLLVNEEIERPSLLELEVRGQLKLGAPWARLRIEVFDKGEPNIPATSFEDEYLKEGLSAENFKHFSFPILGIVKHPAKVQIMVVGPSETDLEIRHIHLR
ncbi:MAG: hypothetical protein WC632_06515 [Candidatus Margulisiibacteriota bacterium]